MSKKQLETFYWPGLKKIMKSVIDSGSIPMLFCEGHCNSRLEYFLELPQGKFVLHLDWTDIFRAKAILGRHCCLMGNVPNSLLQVCSPQEVEEYCRNLIKVCGKGGGFILRSATDSIEDAKPANIMAMVDSVKKYGWY